MTPNTAAPSPATRGRTITLALALAASLLFLLAVNANGASAAVQVKLEHCKNGPVDAPHKCDYTAAEPDPWVVGALNENNAHYFEGESIPNRLVFDGLSTVTAGNKNLYTLSIEYDTTKDGKHAYDFLTSYNFSEGNADPCSEGTNKGNATIPGCDLATATQMAIPDDPKVPGTIAQGNGGTPGQMTLFGGTLVSVSEPARSGTYADTSTTTVIVQFRATNPNPVLAWGSHLAKRSDWGGPTSVDINGATYHVNMKTFSDPNVNNGNRDLPVQNGAVIYPGKLTVVKDAQPDSTKEFTFKTSGAGLSDFGLVDDGVAGPPSHRKVFDKIGVFGSKTVTEDSEADWDLESISCSGNSSKVVDTGTRRATLNIQEGHTNECTFVNKRKTGTLRVVKTVTNDNGGTLGPDDFKLHVKDGATDVAGSPDVGKVYTLPTGTYGVSEDKVDGYELTGFSGDCVEDANDSSTASVTVLAKQEVVCTLTNDDVAPELTVKKVVVNDDGGTAAPSAFTMNVTGSSVSDASFPGDAAGTPVTLDAGAYSVDEAAAPGYEKTLSPECAGTLVPGDKVTCTITNDDIAPELTVKKVVVNDDGGTAAADAFTMNVTGTSVSDDSFPGDAAGTPVTLDAGAYSVDEAAAPGYAKSLSKECAGAIDIGDKVTCTVTNDDVAPKLTVTKTVVGGTATAGDFTMLVTNAAPSLASFPGDAAGTPVTLRAGAYSVDEATTGPDGYTKALSGDCSGTIAIGETKACEITNTREPDPIEEPKEEPKEEQAPLQISGTPVTPLPAAPQQQVRSQVVASPRVRRGKAKLQSPTGCRSSAFKARVSGQEIRTVTFTVDGKQVARLSKANASGAWVYAIRPGAHRFGTHRLAARVTFTKTSQTKAKTLRRTFLRCARPAARPQFTG